MKDKQKRIRSSLSTQAFSDFYAEHDNVIKEGPLVLLIVAVAVFNQLVPVVLYTAHKLVEDKVQFFPE